VAGPPADAAVDFHLSGGTGGKQDAARNTRLAYGRDLKDFADWLARRGGHFASAEQADVEAYLVYCDAQGLAVATRARRLSAIRQLFLFRL
jgi:integrase/recombinase XerD